MAFSFKVKNRNIFRTETSATVSYIHAYPVDQMIRVSLDHNRLIATLRGFRKKSAQSSLSTRMKMYLGLLKKKHLPSCRKLTPQ